MSEANLIDVVQMRMRVHNAFKAKGLSIRAAERECGVAVGTFQKFIAGENETVGADTLALLANLTGISADALLFGEGRSLAGNEIRPGATAAPGTRHVPHNLIAPSALNPRKRGYEPDKLRSLADSILAQGLMQNLVVRPVEASASETGPFEIVAGERRWRAYALLIAEGKAGESVMLPCAVRDLSDDAAMELMLVENMEREELSPMEEGRAFLELWTRRMRAFGKRKAGDVVKYLADRLNRSTRFIQKRIRLARDLVPEAQEALEDGKITLAHAEVLATAPKDAQRAQTGLLTALPIDAHPPARQIGFEIARDLPDLALAVFDRKHYDAEVFEFDGKDFAVDVALFARMQDKAIEAKRAGYTKQLKAGQLAFIAEGTAFKASDYAIVDREDLDAFEEGAVGLYIEVQDKGAWREARFIENLERKADQSAPAPKRAKDTSDGDDEDCEDRDDLFEADGGAARPPAQTKSFDPGATKAAAEKQFGPLRAALQNRADLCLALMVFEDVMFEVGEFDDNARLRIAPCAGYPTDRARAEGAVTKLGLTWPGENDDGAAFAATLLDKLLDAMDGQLLRFVAQIIAADAGASRPLELNALERRVFQAAGLDPDAATVKEAA